MKRHNIHLFPIIELLSHHTLKILFSSDLNNLDLLHTLLPKATRFNMEAAILRKCKGKRNKKGGRQALMPAYKIPGCMRMYYQS